MGYVQSIHTRWWSDPCALGVKSIARGENVRHGPACPLGPLSRPSAHVFTAMSGLSRVGRARSGQMSRVRGHVRIATGGTESERAEDSGWKLGNCRDGNICATFMTVCARLHGDVRGVFFLAPFFLYFIHDRMGTIYISASNRASNVLFVHYFCCIYGIQYSYERRRLNAFN